MIPAAVACWTKAVVANFTELSPELWVTPIVPVGKVGVPVKVGEALSAFASTAACKATPAVACWTKAVVAKAVELFPLFCVTPMVPAGKLGVPEKIGETRSAFESKLACKATPKVARST